jgi:hypothetical protein
MGLLLSKNKSNKRWGQSIFFGVVFSLVFIRTYHPNFPAYSHFSPFGSGSEDARLLRCNDLPGIEDVFVIVKTGATEVRPRLPQTLDVTLRCIPDFAVFSDFEENAFGVQIHDVLASYDEKIKSTHPDFALYRTMNKLGSVSKLMPSDLIIEDAGNHNGHGSNAAWVLDKWKFAPAIDLALQLRPNKKWFFIIEVDTFVIWPNLLKWISKLNATEEHYVGSAMSIGDDTFAYGGAGTLLSNPAMRKISAHRNESVKSWDERTSDHWAGDALLGLIVKDAGIDLKWSHPLMVTDGVEQAEYGGSSWEWNMGCSPAVTFHHMHPDEIRRLTMFEREWFRVVSDNICFSFPNTTFLLFIILTFPRTPTPPCFTTTFSNTTFYRGSSCPLSPRPPLHPRVSILSARIGIITAISTSMWMNPNLKTSQSAESCAKISPTVSNMPSLKASVNIAILCAWDRKRRSMARIAKQRRVDG